MTPTRSISARIRDLVLAGDVAGDQADLLQMVQEVQAMERITQARTVHVAANGKFPGWSVERWCAVIGSIVGTVGAVFAGLAFVFVSGGRWSSMESATREITTIREQVTTMHGDVTAVTNEVRQNRENVDRRLNDISDRVDQATQEARNAARTAATVALSLGGRGGRGGGQP